MEWEISFENINSIRMWHYIYQLFKDPAYIRLTKEPDILHICKL